MTPLVTVYIPAYKAEETLEKAVNSALSQMDNLEVIIVDDCSPDGTFAVAQKLAEKDARVRVFRLEQNSGAPCAMNYAFKQAHGQWLALLDADDWYEAGRLENMLAEAIAQNVEMVADNQYFFDKHANQVVGTAFPQKGRKQVVDLDVFLANSNATKRFDYGMLKPMFRADFIKEHAIEYYTPTYIGYDYCILLCFFAAGGRAVLIDTPYYSYVQPFGSLSKKPQQEGRKHYNHVMQKDVNLHFIEALHGKITQSQMAQLQRRGREIDALICFYELKEAVQKKAIKTIFKILTKTNLEFWKMMFRKVLNRMRCGVTGN